MVIRQWGRNLRLALQRWRHRADEPADDRLLSLLFHGTPIDPLASANCVHPLHEVRAEQVLAIAQALRADGYTLIDGETLLAGRARGRLACLTFDEGYANNLPVLRELSALGIPALLFVSTSNVSLQRCFWWDVAWRGMRSSGMPAWLIVRRLERLKLLPLAEVEQQLEQRFGSDAFRPHGEDDRPLRIDELRQLAALPGITLGTHGQHHGVFTRLDDAALRHELDAPRDDLRSWIGQDVLAVAYPNGDHDARVRNSAGLAGYRLGFTCEHGLDPTPHRLDPQRSLRLRRFTCTGYWPIRQQLRLWAGR